MHKRNNTKTQYKQYKTQIRINIYKRNNTKTQYKQ